MPLLLSFSLKKKHTFILHFFSDAKYMSWKIYTTFWIIFYLLYAKQICEINCVPPRAAFYSMSSMNALISIREEVKEQRKVKVRVRESGESACKDIFSCTGCGKGKFCLL